MALFVVGFPVGKMLILILTLIEGNHRKAETLRDKKSERRRLFDAELTVVHWLLVTVAGCVVRVLLEELLLVVRSLLVSRERVVVVLLRLVSSGTGTMLGGEWCGRSWAARARAIRSWRRASRPAEGVLGWQGQPLGKRISRSVMVV